jgi:RimJ/RimL family protein N-acetyltransferase
LADAVAVRQFERTRPGVWGAGRAGQAWIFVGDGPLGTRQDARIGHDWVEEIGLDPTAYAADEVADAIGQKHRWNVPHRMGPFGSRIANYSDGFPGLCSILASVVCPIRAEYSGEGAPCLSGVCAPHFSSGGMNTLRADSLVLEPQLESHAAEMFGVLSDPAIYEFENEPPRTVAALGERCARLESRTSTDGSEQWLNWVVKLPSGELAGYVQATVLPGGCAYVAYELASRFWRQGIGSAALQLVLRELAQRYAVRDAYAVLKAANFRSLGLLRKLGFVPLPPTAQAPWTPEPDEVTMQRVLAGEDTT